MRWNTPSKFCQLDCHTQLPSSICTSTFCLRLLKWNADRFSHCPVWSPVHSSHRRKSEHFSYCSKSSSGIKPKHQALISKGSRIWRPLVLLSSPTLSSSPRSATLSSLLFLNQVKCTAFILVPLPRTAPTLFPDYLWASRWHVITSERHSLTTKSKAIRELPSSTAPYFQAR